MPRFNAKTRRRKDAGQTVRIANGALLDELFGLFVLVHGNFPGVLQLADNVDDLLLDLLDFGESNGAEEFHLFLEVGGGAGGHAAENLSLIHISEPTRLLSISYAVFCL